jgi:hypothetical protein
MDHQAFAQLLGNYGEFVGAIAVVVTLGYLSVQVRANARITAMDARQRVLDRFSDAKANTINGEVTSTILKAMAENTKYEDLSEAEVGLLFPVITTFADNLYNAIRLRNEGALDEEAFNYIAQAFMNFCASPAGRVWWNTQFADMAPQTLKDFVETQLV